MAQLATQYNILELSEEDLDYILEIEDTSFKSPWPREVFEMEFKNKRAYNIVCKNERGELIGYCLSWLIYDEVHILKVAVNEDYRNLGIGRRLIVNTLEYFIAKGANHAILEVRLDNYSAISLYEKLGFENLRIRKNYYRETGEDALVMLLDLEEKFKLRQNNKDF